MTRTVRNAMTDKKNPSLVTVLMWVVGLAVAADILIVVSRQPQIPEIPASKTPAAIVAVTPTPPPSAPEPPELILSVPITNNAPSESLPAPQPSGSLSPVAPVTNDEPNAPLQ